MSLALVKPNWQQDGFGINLIANKRQTNLFAQEKAQKRF